MKKSAVLLFSLALSVLVCRAQGVLTNAGWFPIGTYDDLITDDTNQDDGTIQLDVNIVPMTSTAPASIAEVVTPQLQALADGLQDDPVRIFNYVHDHIRYVLYFGSKKGAQLTLLEKSGNDFDQAALLVALLRAASYTNAGYQFGWMTLPFDNPDGSDRDLHHWLGLNFTNADWPSTSAYLQELFTFWRGYPNNVINAYSDRGSNYFAFQRVWVTLTNGGSIYYLDPAFKVSEPIGGVSLAAAMGGSASSLSNALMSAAGGGDFGNFSTAFYATNLNEGAVRTALAANTTSLLNYIQNNCPNASVEQVLGGQYIVPSTDTALSQSLLFPTTNMNGTMPVITWVNQPTNLMSTLKITFAGAAKTCKWYMPQLQGQRLSLVYGLTTAQLWQDDNELTNGVFSGSDNVTLTAYHPYGNWNTTNNTYIPGVGYVASAPATYSTNSSYALLYAFEPDWGWLRERQKQLELYRQQGYSNTSRQVVTETLNVMGLNWQMQVEYVGRMLGAQIGVLPMYYQRIGRMAQESGRGYYVDVYLDSEGTPGNIGHACNFTCDLNSQKWMDLMCYFASAMEHGMIEQLQASNLVAASAVKMLERANTNRQAVYLVASTNWAAVQGKLSNYNLNDLASLISLGYQLLLPQDGSFGIGSGGWTGFGFLARLWNGGGTKMLIGPGTFGGYVSDLGAEVDSDWVSFFDYSQPAFFNFTPPSLPSFTAADPVDVADGTFQAEGTDLAVGQSEPRGLSFSRYYNSSRRTSNLAGMAPGWLHNYYLNAATISSPQAALGGTTPAQAAGMLAATASALCVYNGSQPDPKNWLVTALIAKWGVDQLTAKAVSVSLGKDTVQFIKQPDGSFTPPANCTMTLLQTNSGYWLQERHGRAFQFNSAGWATSIVDPYGQSATLGYNSSNWVTSVSDWKGRSLTLNYSTTTPERLVSVSDNTGRSVALGYSGSSNLVSVADPENKTNTFSYDTNHQITATLDALSRLVTSNRYDSQGHMTTQYTQGDPTKMWRVYWSGWQTDVQDPAGGTRHSVYDDKTRLIAQQDELGNLSQSFYDGQDHVVMTISPLNETNQSIYDGNNNCVATIDPLGYSNQFFYDSLNNLYRSVDKRGNPSSFGYNSQFSPTGATNGAGDWVSLTYNTGGTLATRAEPGGTTRYSYDTLGQVNLVTYPDSLGVEGFLNSTNGDVLSYTNGRGNVVSFQYNSRRQLTNSVAPTNVVSKVAYDPAGNQQTATDPRGFVTTAFWSPTRHQTGTVFPATPQGIPATTNLYDSRDWLMRTADPLGQPTLYASDAAGRVASVTDPLLRTNWLGVDADGRQIAVTNAARERVLYTRNARGEVTRATDNANHTVLSAHDGAGNQILLTNRNGKPWQFQFDLANRLVSTITPRGRSNVVVFSNRGLVQSVTDAMQQPTSLGYDGRRRLTSITDNLGVRSCYYDADNNLTNLTQTINTQQSTLNFTYDAYDRVSGYSDPDGNLIQYRYDSSGNLTNLIYPGNKNVYYGYDSLNRVTNVTDWAHRQTTITYDLASRAKSITRPNGTIRIMNYDTDGEVTNIVERTLSNFPIAFFTLGWTNTGRLAWEFAAPLPPTNALPSRTMTYNDDNQIATFRGPTMGSAAAVGYDADGNLTSGPLTNDTFASYGYDVRNRLTNAGGLTYSYDPAGNRTSITNGGTVTHFVINPNAGLPQVLIRTKPDSSQTFYVYGLGLLYEVNCDSGGTELNTRTYHYDCRGSTVALTDGSGMPTDRVAYSSYGLTTLRVGTTDTPFLFNGRYGVMTDANGLLYMQARYYNPYICRFINADPSGFGGGLNWYAYAGGDPISMVDPFGLGAVEAATGGSWMNQVWSGLGLNNSIAAQQNREQAVIGAVNLVTMGLANDASSVLTGAASSLTGGSGLGYDLAGNVTTRQEQFVSAVMLGLALIPGEDLEATAGRAGLELGEVAAENAPTAYSVAFEMQLAPEQLGLRQAQHFQIANQALQAEQAVNPALAELVPAPTGWGRPPAGWTWQHATIDQGGGSAGVMQLVPRYQHTPGSPFWPLLHPLPGGAGGYSQWAIPAGAPQR